ncbi:MAG TPA: HAMP domain-containing sensor histidine kinase [Chryseosolibacter sp.]|nr:HAMP domain-containing sensor histidine kinase [Chryseosolibacter sp.]
MSRNRVWLYAVVLFVLVGTILTTQVSWLMESARIEESFLSQRVNMALCSAMDVLSKDRGLCSNVESCVSHGRGTFEISFTQQEKAKIDSIIKSHLSFYNIYVPFKTTFSPYTTDTTRNPLPLSQALLYPAKAGMQNVLVHIEIPSQAQLAQSQINGTFILSFVVLIALIWIFISTVKALIREQKIRKETVDFINTMAHDLKTPISNISFALSLFNREQENTNTPKNQFVSIIETETGRLKDRARKILGMASVDAVLEDSTDQTEINIHELIDQAVDSYTLKLHETNGSIEKHLNAGKAIVKGSQLQLSSAIMNIIDNAITYSHGSSLIRIRTRNDENGIRIEVEDNGPGIPSSELELVFRKAYRVRSGNKLPEGFGLGLYIARTSVEKNGGKLSLSSDGVSGSCFVIQLPLS